MIDRVSDQGGVAAFLVARLDELEAAASAAAAKRKPPWRLLDQADMRLQGRVSSSPPGASPAVIDRAGVAEVISGTVGAHVAANDPARVLREVEAGRGRLKLMAEATADMDRLLGDPRAGDVERAMAIGRARAATVAVKYDAAIWSDHPDYRQEWKP